MPSGGANVNAENLSKLDRMLSIIDKYNMKAIVTLLDWCNPYTNIDDQLQHVRSIVTKFKDDPRIFAWDVRNEPDHYYYGGWTPYASKPYIMNYISQIINEVKSDDHNHLVSVGEYGWFLGDRTTTNTIVLNDDFSSGSGNWDIESGAWDTNSGFFRGYNGISVAKDHSWWSKWGLNITLRMKTESAGSESWNVGRILFRYIDDNNYYALILKTDEYLELAKMQNGVWHNMLANVNVSKDPLTWHTFHIVSFRNETEVYFDGNRVIYFWDDNPINSSGNIYGGLALQAEGGSTVDFDDVRVELGPCIIRNDINNYGDFVIFHWYEDTAVLNDALSKLRAVIHRPVLIEEMGRPTGGKYSNGDPVPWNEDDVAEWMKDNLNVIKNYEGVYPSVWTLLDFSDSGVPPNTPSSELHFGLYDTSYRLKKNGYAFRDNFTGTQLNNDAEFESAEHPQSMNCGETKRVTISMKNTGDTYWDRNRNYRLGSQDPQDNLIWGTGRVEIQSGKEVYPGDTYTFSFNITAPQVPGKYSFSWRMVREYVEWFGETYHGSIMVYDPALSVEMSDEMNTMDNWTVQSGNAYTSGGEMLISGMVFKKGEHSGDVYFSYRARSDYGSNALTFIYAESENDYLGFRLNPNGTAEILQFDGSEHSIASASTSYRPQNENTFFIRIASGRMDVYIDGQRVMENIDVSSYLPSTGYLGFYMPSNDAYVDHAGLYSQTVPEFSTPTFMPILITLTIIFGRFRRKTKHL